jgi:hypothetical protein
VDLKLNIKHKIFHQGICLNSSATEGSDNSLTPLTPEKTPEKTFQKKWQQIKTAGVPGLGFQPYILQKDCPTSLSRVFLS